MILKTCLHPSRLYLWKVPQPPRLCHQLEAECSEQWGTFYTHTTVPSLSQSPFLSGWKHSVFSLISCYKEFPRRGFSQQLPSTLWFASFPFWSMGCGGAWVQGLVSSLHPCSGFNSTQLSLLAALCMFGSQEVPLWPIVVFVSLRSCQDVEERLHSGLQRLDVHSHLVPSLVCKLCVPFCLCSWRRGVICLHCLSCFLISERGLQC